MKDYRITVKVRNNRILKAVEETGSTFGGKWTSPGWVLPGGRRTTDAVEAISAATWIDAQMRKHNAR